MLSCLTTRLSAVLLASIYKNMIYTKEQINNNIRRMLEEGRNNDDALDLFLKMKMENNLGPEQAFIKKGPSPACSMAVLALVRPRPCCR